MHLRLTKVNGKSVTVPLEGLVVESTAIPPGDKLGSKVTTIQGKEFIVEEPLVIVEHLMTKASRRSKDSAITPAFIVYSIDGAYKTNIDKFYP